jgi:hypothetical protein
MYLDAAVKWFSTFQQHTDIIAINWRQLAREHGIADTQLDDTLNDVGVPNGHGYFSDLIDTVVVTNDDAPLSSLTPRDGRVIDLDNTDLPEPTVDRSNFPAVFRAGTPENAELRGLIVEAVATGMEGMTADIGVQNEAMIALRRSETDQAIHAFVENANYDTTHPLHHLIQTVVTDPNQNHNSGQQYDVYHLSYGNENPLGLGDLNYAISQSTMYSTDVIILRTPGESSGSLNPPVGTIYNGRVFSPTLV